MNYDIVTADPATGIIYVVNNFISGHVRLRGRSGGQYPYKYLEMVDNLFGKADHTIEVCSGSMKSNNNLTTVDAQNEDADIVADAINLDFMPPNTFDRWRADPPYGDDTAASMYNCKMPSLNKLLSAGARVVKRNALLFLLCSQNHQMCPKSLKRIGLILITIVPNNEIRALNIYAKL